MMRRRRGRFLPLHLLCAALAATAAEAASVPHSAGELLWEDYLGPEGLAIAAGHGLLFDAGARDDEWVVTAYNANDGTVTWEDHFSPGAGYGTATEIAVLGDTVYASGQIYLEATGKWIWVVRAHEALTGELVWSDEFDHGGGINSVRSIAAGGGIVAVAGSAVPSGGTEDEYNWLVRVHDAETGEVHWQDSLTPGPWTSIALATTISRGVVYTGGAVSSPVVQAWVVRAQDARTGRLVWEDVRTEGGYISAVLDIAIRGNLVVAAGYRSTDGMPRFAVVAYDASTGDQRWQDLDPRDCFGYAIRVAASGPVVVAGHVTSFDLVTRMIVRAYDPVTGRYLWQDVYEPGGGHALPHDVSLHGGVVAVAGSGRLPGGTTDWLVRAYDAKDGNVLWTDLFSVGGGLSSRALSVLVRGGKVHATGCSCVLGPGILRVYDAK